MLRSICRDSLVPLTLLFLTLTGSKCSAQDEVPIVRLPGWRPNAEYVTQCFYNERHILQCDWTWSQQQTASGGAINILKSDALGLRGEACLEFWYFYQDVGSRSTLQVQLRGSGGVIDIWTTTVSSSDSWRQVFVPLTVTEQNTQIVLMGEGAIFDYIGVRRGSCGPQCESDMEQWTDESTLCVCAAGQLSCRCIECPEGQDCGPPGQSPLGTLSSGTCAIHSDTDCSTFDGVLFRFMAPCTYVLAKTCSPTENPPPFTVEVVNEQDGNSSLTTVKQVIVIMEDFRISLLKRQTHRVAVNGIWKKLPLTLSSGTVIKGNRAAVVVETRFGLTVSYDSAGAVHVNLPSSYSDKVCGLCGNFNRDKGDDLRMPNGTEAQNATELVESWQTGETSSTCEAMMVPHQCEQEQEDEYASELHCGSLLSKTGPFSGCLAVLEVESYFRRCVAGMCSSHGDPTVLCETLQAYAQICQEAGMNVPSWRNSTFCSQCGENSHYNSCAEGCPEVCSGSDLTVSCGSCVERCECDSGFKLSGGKCVPAEDCGCWLEGQHYEKGATFMRGECTWQCFCEGNNVVRCSATKCSDTEVCKVKDGVKGCFPFRPATCSVYGDPHYITYDGFGYDFQGGCSYTLTTTCGGESSVEFTVIGHNVHPPHQNFTRSKLEAVTLQVDGLRLTLNQSGAVYAQNGRLPLPFSAHGKYGTVKVYAESNYIIMETTFGLRMMLDGQNRLFLQVDEHYKYELCGLCGTYSDHQDDDLVTPGGKNATGPFEFGDSWRVQSDTECVANPNKPTQCDSDEEDEGYRECNALLGDAFKPCHEVLHPEVYIASCVYDYCATGGDQHTLCDSLTSYAAACRVAGVELVDWQTGTACADPPTTAPPPTTSAPTSPTPDQTICPMNCDFDQSLCGWEQLIQDSFDWTRHSGATPSQGTGPNQDHTSGAGFYMYIEGNGVTHGDSARLLSSRCHLNSPVCFSFWYHMYGSATAMALNIYVLQGITAKKIWSVMGNQGSQWHPGQIEITVSGPFQVILEGIRGSTVASDVAIDDISIHSGSCQGPSAAPVTRDVLPPATTEALPSNSVSSLDCNFDRGFCNWSQMITDAFDWTWQTGSTPTLMTGPSADHTGGGHYLYIEASTQTHGNTARLISPGSIDSGPQCLRFWYHMYGSADTMGLHVYLLQGSLAKGIWIQRNDQGNMWHEAQVDFTPSGPFQIIFEGRRGSNEESDVAIDDITLHRGPCAGSELPPANNSTLQPPTTTVRTQPTTATAGPQPPPTTAGPHPPPTTAGPHPPPTTAGPQPPTTTAEPQPPPTTTEPQPTTATAGPQPPTTTAEPQPTTATAGPQPTTTAHTQPTTAGPHPPPTTAGPHPPPTTAGPHPPPTTAGPQPPPTTAGPQPPTTTAGPQPPTKTAVPQPPTTTAVPQPPTTTVGPQPPPTTAVPQPPTTTAVPQPPTSAHPQPTTAGPHPPAPSCPVNSHYNTCIPACNPTCAHLNGPPDCKDDARCQEGCVCDDGFVLKGKVCVPILQCGCVDRNGNKYQFNELWRNNHCSERCKCEKDDGVGKIDCDDEEQCEEGSVCLQSQEGDYYCQEADFEECNINGDLEYRTFDRLKYHFLGEHSYVLVHTHNLPNHLQDIYIEGIHSHVEDDEDDSSSEESHSRQARDDDDDDSEEDEAHPRLRELKIRVYNYTVELKPKRKLVVNGVRTKLPFSPNPGLNIRKHSHIYLETDFGLSVEFDGRHEADITLPHQYRGLVRGLCGNYDRRKRNDRMKPDGTMAATVQELGESWRAQ